MLELGATCGMGLDYGNIPCAGGITLIAPINGVSVWLSFHVHVRSQHPNTSAGTIGNLPLFYFFCIDILLKCKSFISG